MGNAPDKAAALVNSKRAEGAEVVQMLRSPAGKWFVPLEVDGTKVALMLDTGADLVTSLGGLKLRAFSYALAGGAGRELPDQLDGVKVAGLLGSNPLRPFKAVVDFESGRIAFPAQAAGGAR